jgi:aminoglycoside phosphotransferase (APT) family kinase protein
VRRTLEPVVALKNVLSRMTGRRHSAVRPADVSFHSTLAKSLIDDLSGRLGKPCNLIDFHATRTGSLTVRIRADRSYVAKLPLQASTEPRLRQNAQTLRVLGQFSWVTPFLSARCPALVLLGTASGYFYSVETTVPGQDGASISRAGGSAEEMILSAAYFLSKLQKASLEVSTLAPPSWEPSFESAVERVEQLAKRAGSARDYDRLVADIRNRLSAQPIPTVYSHGNFWLGNVLFDTANNLTGVIDWDCATAFSLPALDLIYLLVRTQSLARSTSFGEALADWIDAESLPFLDDCITRHCRELSIPTELIAPLSYCSWIQHLDAHCRFGTSTSADPRWLDRNVRQVLHRWRLRTTTGRREARW